MHAASSIHFLALPNNPIAPFTDQCVIFPVRKTKTGLDFKSQQCVPVLGEAKDWEVLRGLEICLVRGQGFEITS